MIQCELLYYIISQSQMSASVLGIVCMYTNVHQYTYVYGSAQCTTMHSQNRKFRLTRRKYNFVCGVDYGQKRLLHPEILVLDPTEISHNFLIFVHPFSRLL